MIINKNMPYIKQEDRKKYDGLVEDIVDVLTEHGFKPADVGHANYVISSIIWKLFDQNKRYKTANDLAGVLSCVDKEFYRRKVVPYEDEKIKENGDL